MNTYTLKNGKKIIVRPVKIIDVAQKVIIWNKAMEEDDYLLIKNKTDIKKLKTRVKESIEGFKQKNKMELVADLDGKILGFIGLTRGRGRMIHTGDVGIVIDSDYRAMGIGTALNLELAKIAKKWGIKILVGTVMDTNKKSLGMVDKIGMKKFGTLPKGIERKGKLIKLHYFYKEI